nr:hypothetical protein [Snodgrassella alvi]
MTGKWHSTTGNDLSTVNAKASWKAVAVMTASFLIMDQPQITFN